MQKFVLVPYPVCEEMVKAACAAIGSPGMFHVLNAAIAAAPHPPALGGEPEVTYMLRNTALNTPWQPADKAVFDSAASLVEYERCEMVDRAHVTRLQAEVDRLKEESFESLYNEVIDERDKLQVEVERLTALLDTPHTQDWFEGVRLESGHQIKRWGTERDAGKTPADWFWLIGYLSQKAMTAQMTGDDAKARHHTISTGAAMLNWFRAIVGDSNAMRPGINAALAEGKEHGSTPISAPHCTACRHPDCNGRCESDTQAEHFQ